MRRPLVTYGGKALLIAFTLHGVEDFWGHHL